jgi:hypothetical protein
MDSLSNEQSSNSASPEDAFAKSEKIKARYLESGMQASDVDNAVNQLLADCSELFESGEHAWTFLMEETHENLEQ